MSEPNPRTIGRYELGRELGRGMMGIVYEAHDPALGRTVALKTVRPGYAPEGGPENFEARFLAEARAAAVLSHPGIVIVHDVGRDAETGTLFIALEYLKGKPLSDWTAQGTSMSWGEALRICARVAEALHEAHTHGIIHRDIKPANIMILPSGDPKIMDFGIAKIQSSQLTAAGQFFGTPLYMSPEQVLGARVDARSDLFSLGAVLYLLLTGRQAFDGPSVPVILKKVLQEDPPAPSKIVSGLPRSADAVVARALAKRPADRYPEGKAFAHDLDDLRAGKAPKIPRRVAPQGTVVSASIEDLGLDPIGPGGAKEPQAGAAAEGGSRPSEAPPPRSAAGTAWAALGLVAVIAMAWWTQLPKAVPSPSVAPAPSQTSRGSTLLPPSPAVPHADRSGEAAAAAAPSVEPPPSHEPTPEAARAPSPSPVQGASPAAPPRPSPRPTHTPAPQTGQLALDFEHPLKEGTLRVFVDDDLVLDQEVAGREAKELLALKVHKGSLQRLLPVPPGRHQLRVVVSWEGNQKSEAITGVFQAGVTRRLSARLGRIRKDLSLEWK